MIALIASALLGLYVFAPYILFHRFSSLFIRLKKFQRSKTDEIVFGVVVAGLPFVVTLALFGSGFIGGPFVPFALNDSHSQKVSDYQTVFTAADSDHYFAEHQAESWNALQRVCMRQADFLVWNFGFVFVETVVFVGLVRFYGRWKDHKVYGWIANRVLLPAVSEWTVLLTDFSFSPAENRSVEVDALSKDNILYRGNVDEYFLGANGELTGLLLREAQRFQYDKLKDDRKSKVVPQECIEQYWKPIPGRGNFYLPGDNIASLNIRYTQLKADYERTLKEMIRKLLNTDVTVGAIPQDKPSTEDEIRRRAFELSQQRDPGSGSEAEDWLTAEREVKQRYHQQNA